MCIRDRFQTVLFLALFAESFCQSRRIVKLLFFFQDCPCLHIDIDRRQSRHALVIQIKLLIEHNTQMLAVHVRDIAKALDVTGIKARLFDVHLTVIFIKKRLLFDDFLKLDGVVLQEKLKEYVGHTPIQVAAGAILGILIAFILDPMFI